MTVSKVEPEKIKLPKNPQELNCDCGVTVKVGRYHKDPNKGYKCASCRGLVKKERV